jgi:hypothetical protein
MESSMNSVEHNAKLEQNARPKLSSVLKQQVGTIISKNTSINPAICRNIKFATRF